MEPIDFTSVLSADIGPTDLARILKVGRVSCSYWLSGKKQPHPLHRDQVKAVVDAITAATQAGLLPVPLDVMQRERAHYIQQALEKVRQA